MIALKTQFLSKKILNDANRKSKITFTDKNQLGFFRRESLWIHTPKNLIKNMVRLGINMNHYIHSTAKRTFCNYVMTKRPTCPWHGANIILNGLIYAICAQINRVFWLQISNVVYSPDDLFVCQCRLCFWPSLFVLGCITGKFRLSLVHRS